MHRMLAHTHCILVLVAILIAQAPSRILAQAPMPPQALQDLQTDTDSLPSPASKSETRIPTKARSGQLTGDERLLQVLNRFTYGPRPGDLERLRAIGLQAWFNQQLNPQSINDSALDQRLADYPAIQLPLPQLMARFPGQPVIRRFMDGKQDRPSGEAEKAIYADEVFRYNAGKNQAATVANTPAPPEPRVVLPVDPQAVLNLPPDQRFAELCKLTPPQLRALREQLPAPDRPRILQGFTPQQTEAVIAFNGPPALIDAELLQTKLLRDLYSERQLNEIMTDFWLNHFNVYTKKSQEAPYYIAAYERTVIRPRALGNFENLLLATAMSPAMLSYLDNAVSVGPHSPFAERANLTQKRDLGLNENYARELMELQTVGVNGGYTQQDVTEVAKVFTGWTIGSPVRGGVPFMAQFDPAKHEPGPKHVLGVTIHESGSSEGIEVLHLLANSPQTARFISTKLAIRFVSDTPPPAMIDRMARTFLSTHGDIRRVLLSMVNSPEFFRADSFRAKVKTPQDFVLSAVRASGAQVDSAGALVNVIGDLGMPLYGMQTPNGYSMESAPWNNTASLVARLNFALALSTNRVAGVHTDWAAMLGLPNPPAAVANYPSPNSRPPAAASSYSLTPGATSTAPTVNPTPQFSNAKAQPTNPTLQKAQVTPQQAKVTPLPASSVTQQANPAATSSAQQAKTTAQLAIATGQEENPTGQEANAAAREAKATALEATLEEKLLHMPASPHTQQAILAQITATPAQQEASLRQVAIQDRHRDPLALRSPGPPQSSRDTPPNPQAALAAGLLFGSPEFQRR